MSRCTTLTANCIPSIRDWRCIRTSVHRCHNPTCDVEPSMIQSQRALPNNACFYACRFLTRQFQLCASATTDRIITTLL
jgi:hypothetical protein